MAELVWVKKYFRLIVMIATDHKVFWIWEMTVSSCLLIAVSLTVNDWRVHTAPSGCQYLKGEAILILPLQKRELGALVVLCCRSWAVSLQNCFPFLLLQKRSRCKVNTSSTVQTLRLTAANWHAFCSSTVAKSAVLQRRRSHSTDWHDDMMYTEKNGKLSIDNWHTRGEEWKAKHWHTRGGGEWKS